MWAGSREHDISLPVSGRAKGGRSGIPVLQLCVTLREHRDTGKQRKGPSHLVVNC